MRRISNQGRYIGACAVTSDRMREELVDRTYLPVEPSDCDCVVSRRHTACTPRNMAHRARRRRRGRGARVCYPHSHFTTRYL